MNGWDNFFFAQVGASAALTGLIFVGVSINLVKILAVPKLPNRAFQALILLLAALVISSVLLMPGQSPAAIGTELLAVGASVWLIVVVIDVLWWRSTQGPHRSRIPGLIVMNQLSVLPYLVAGVMILRSDFRGIYWVAGAILASFVKAFLDAWVLLIEINR